MAGFCFHEYAICWLGCERNDPKVRVSKHRWWLEHDFRSLEFNGISEWTLHQQFSGFVASKNTPQKTNIYKQQMMGLGRCIETASKMASCWISILDFGGVCWLCFCSPPGDREVGPFGRDWPSHFSTAKQCTQRRGTDSTAVLLIPRWVGVESGEGGEGIYMLIQKSRDPSLPVIYFLRWRVFFGHIFGGVRSYRTSTGGPWMFGVCLDCWHLCVCFPVGISETLEWMMCKKQNMTTKNC